ncbi:MAG: hypothetical protein FWB71_07520 [Defluviitaleaceae bacterium]|nr:hypothetical protein [Defluviitaleaceae bacterium]
MSENNHNIKISEAERYAQINDPADNRLEAILGNLGELYPGFTVDICYHNQEHPAEIISRLGAQIIDDSIEMRLEIDNFKPDIGEAFLMPSTMWFDFAAIHDARHPDMYWTSRRIAAHRGFWDIFVTRENNSDEQNPPISGYLLAANTTHEIFCVASNSPAESRHLLTAAVRHAFNSGASQVLRMVERADTAEQTAARALGFTEHGYYRGFRLVLPTE